MGPGQHPRYTRADFGQEAVGGSTTTTRARKQHATRDTQCEQQGRCSLERDCGTRVVNTETGGDLTPGSGTGAGHPIMTPVHESAPATDFF